MKKYDNILNFYKEYIKIEQIIRKGWLMRNVPAERLESVGGSYITINDVS